MEYKRNVRSIEITLLYMFIIMTGCVEIMKSNHAVQLCREHTNLLFSHTFPVHFHSIMKVQARPDGHAGKKGESYEKE